MKYCELMPV